MCLIEDDIQIFYNYIYNEKYYVDNSFLVFELVELNNN